jgi:hypothetical protein
MREFSAGFIPILGSLEVAVFSREIISGAKRIAEWNVRNGTTVPNVSEIAHSRLGERPDA